MKSIFVPNESFQNKNEISSINKLLSRNATVLLEEIDDQTEIWIIGNKDQEFFDKQTEQAFIENRVLDPIDKLPVSRYKKLKHIAVINHEIDIHSELYKETIYANSDHDVSDFVAIVINLLKHKYPKKKK